MSTAPRRGLPYYRVVAAGGALGGYGGNVRLKVALLAAEGLVVRGRRIQDFSKVRWGHALQRPSKAYRLTVREHVTW